MKTFARSLQVCALMLLFAACGKTPEQQQARVYQCPMHPWITSDKPGNCTICGMALVAARDEKSSAAPSEKDVMLSDASRHILGMETATAQRQRLLDEIHVSGILEDDDTMHRVVAAFYEGRIERVYVQQTGQKVKAGQPLAAIYSPELLYVVREFQNAAKRGTNDPVAINARHRLIQYGLAPAQVDGLANATRDVYTVDVLAPMDGTVLVRKAWQGQYVKNGEPLFETGNLGRMWFKAEIYERDIANIRIGQKARITSPAVPGKSFEGTVTFLDPSFDAATRSTKIRIEVENPPSEEAGSFERQIPHRAYAEATILTELPEALTIPRSALIRDGRREVVYVEKSPGEYQMRAVRAGRLTSRYATILEGLKEGERVVTRGQLMIDAEVQLRTGSDDKKALPDEIKNLLATMDALSAALSADDLSRAKSLAETLVAPAGPGLEGSLPSLTGASTLPEFRKQILPWTSHAASLVLKLRQEGYDVPYRVMQCPMTSQIFEGAPGTARWVQAPGATHNPFLGSSMPDCGTEVNHE